MKNVKYEIQSSSTIITANSSFIDCVIYNSNLNILAVIISGKSYLYGCSTHDYIDFNNVLHITRSLGQSYNAIKKRLVRVN